jgi:hypothetical protein
VLWKPTHGEVLDHPIRARVDDVDRIALAVRDVHEVPVGPGRRREVVRAGCRVDVVRIEDGRHPGQRPLLRSRARLG